VLICVAATAAAITAAQAVTVGLASSQPNMQYSEHP